MLYKYRLHISLLFKEFKNCESRLVSCMHFMRALICTQDTVVTLLTVGCLTACILSQGYGFEVEKLYEVLLEIR